MTSTADRSTGAPWWRDAVIYQVYPRSFADGNDDGTGDVRGITSRLDYLVDLGVDAVWVSPWYPSPLADGGYDVADYCDIHPDFGTLADAEAFIAAAHERGLKVMCDLVPNHTSDEHPWFSAALASAPGSPERARYVFRDGRGPNGDEPPTNWGSIFGGGAWERVIEADGRPGQWYLHLFDRKQPDLNWANPEVADLFDHILRFWFDRGIDGFRVDVADALHKDQDFPDTPLNEEGFGSFRHARDHPLWVQPELEFTQRRWRALADAYERDIVFVSEAYHPDRLELITPGRLHTTFTFDLLFCEWKAETLRAMIDRNLAEHEAVGAPTAWVIGNHDVTRPATRYGKRITGWQFDAAGQAVEDSKVWGDWLFPWPTNLQVGRRRARAAALLELALPGGAYVYQGEELGLDEVEDLPVDRLQDPIFFRTNGRGRGRDGCRVPIPWSGTSAPFGFSESAEPWLPQPAHWAAMTAEAQDGDPDSTLTLYRTALRLRREQPALGDGEISWLPSPAGTVCLARSPGFRCLVNVSADAVPLPEGADVLVASGPLEDGRLPVDTTVWLRDKG